MKTVNNGNERMTAGRDYINEWIYFTYPASNIDYVFPTQTLFYNYRDRSWAVFNECYTTYGQFQKASGFLPIQASRVFWRVRACGLAAPNG